MPYLGENSRNHLAECHPDLIQVMTEAIKTYDFSVICGHRNEVDQMNAFLSGNSQVRWPDSKHNAVPSRAVDIIPYPGGFESKMIEWWKMATHVFAAANKVNVEIEWGGHWRNFKDYPHFQLKDEE